MDYHRDENANASNFYSRKGRIGKKMTGGSNKLAIRRQKLAPLVRSWVRAYKKKNGCEPSQADQRFAIDNPDWLDRQLTALKAGQIVLRSRHVPDCNCKPCIANKPMSGGNWLDFHKRETARIETERAAEAQRKQEEEDAYYAELQKNQRIAKVRAECPIPRILLENYATGDVSQDLLIRTFIVSEDKLKDYCENFGIEIKKVQP
jgi:hypothetical protein